MSSVTFTVIGVPAPQGSKEKWGAEANPRTKPWRATVSADAAEVMHGREMLVGPCALEVVFYFPRPKNHYGSGRNEHVLKPGAPLFVDKKPDCDKLLRAIGDSLTSYVMRDDAQIAAVHAEQVYGSPRALIRVRELNGSAPTLAERILACPAPMSPT